jgi:NAD+ synthase (glutamine-hydrolysing)
LFRPDFIAAAEAAMTAFTKAMPSIAAIIGHPQAVSGQLFNAASLLENNAVVCSYHKQRLPNYQVFDEARYFATGSTPCVFTHRGVKIGVLICEDIWYAEPVAAAVAAGAEMLVVPNASPYDFKKS